MTIEGHSKNAKIVGFQRKMTCAENYKKGEFNVELSTKILPFE